MEGVPRKEHDSTCRQFVWDATTEDIHHDNLVPNTWWAAENTQPCVRMHHTCRQPKAPSKNQLTLTSRNKTQSQRCLQQYMDALTTNKIQKGLLILLDFDASMVCPCGSEVTHRARNMEGVPRKEHDSTCRQFVWDATTEDIHHDNLVPNTWWAAENTQPCVRMHHTCRQPKAPSKNQLTLTSRNKTQSQRCLQQYMDALTTNKIQKGLLILLDFDASMVCPCGSEVTHRARNMEAVPRKEHDSTCRQFVWDATTEDIHHDNLVPNTWWAAENTQPCVRMHHTCRQSKEPSKTTIKVWSTFPQEHVSCIFMYFRI